MNNTRWFWWQSWTFW